MGYCQPRSQVSLLLVPTERERDERRGTRDEGRVEENSENEVGILYGTKKRGEVVKSR